MNIILLHTGHPQPLCHKLKFVNLLAFLINFMYLINAQNTENITSHVLDTDHANSVLYPG